MGYTQFLLETLEQVSHVARQMCGTTTPSIKNGDHTQVVTEADIRIGKMMSNAIQSTFPSHNILDEEAGALDNQSLYTWVIDPIDGTSNFAHGSPHYGIMVGLLKEQEPILSGIALPAFHEIYHAAKGQGAYCGSQQLRITSQESLHSILVAYGIETQLQNPNGMYHEYTLLAEIISRSCGVQSSESVFDQIMVAKGVYGASLYRECKIWDVVAAHLLIEEAGGIFTDFYGKAMDYSDPLLKAPQSFSYCAADPMSHEQLQQIIYQWNTSPSDTHNE